jgi:predicted kinase
MHRLFLIRGYPGSGKTTVGKALQDDDIGVFIDHNAILTFIASIVGNDEGIYEEIHSLEKSMTRKILTEGNTAIVARGFSNLDRLREYISIADSLGIEAIVLTLVVDKDILETRIQAPERLSDFNPTTTPEALHQWIKHNEIEPFENERIIVASREISEIKTIIKQQLES